MDMFFAAVEIRDKPELKDLPVAVGGIGMISTSNYIARQYGVRAAMPGFIAKKLCPNLVFVNCNFAKYEVVSKQMKEIISQYDPHYRSWSLDEVYFDLTNASIQKYNEQQGLQSNRNIVKCIEDEENSEDEASVLSHQQPEAPPIAALRPIAVQLLQEIRFKICEVTNGLTCSAGIANNFMLAKICADINKPNGQYELAPQREAILQFISTLSTRKIPGIGKVTEKILSELGMKTLQDVKESAVKIVHAFTPTSSEFLLRACLGIDSEEGVVDPSIVQQESSVSQSHRKSIGCERTYSAKGISSRSELYQKLEELCHSLSQDIQSSASILGGKTLTLKVKDVAFNLHTKAYTLPVSSASKELIRDAEQLFRIAKELLDSFLPLKVRLLGVSLSKLQFQETSNSSERRKNSLDRFFNRKDQPTSSSSRESATFSCSGMNEDENERGLKSVDDEQGGLSERSHQFEANSIDYIDLVNDHIEHEEEVFHTEEDPSGYLCPICCQSFRGSLVEYNYHLDECLTLSSLGDDRLLKTSPYEETGPEDIAISVADHSDSIKRKLEIKNQEGCTSTGKKKRKSSSTSKIPLHPPQSTLEDFFKK